MAYCLGTAWTGTSAAAHMILMTEIPTATFLIPTAEARTFGPDLPAKRQILAAPALDRLPRGAVLIDAAGNLAVADGSGGFQTTQAEGALPGHSRAVLPAFIIAGPGLPAIVPGGGKIFLSQDEVDSTGTEFHAIDAEGSLFVWDDTWEDFGTFNWVPVGNAEKAAPVFPITAWRQEPTDLMGRLT